MKPWHWILIAGGAIVVIVLIAKTSKSSQPSGAVNGNLNAATGLAGILATLMGGKKVGAPAGTAGSIPGDTGYSYNGLSGQTYGQLYAGAAPGYVASEGAGGGAAAGAAAGAAGYRASEDAGGFLGNGGYTPQLTPQLTAPSFNIGTGGADFSN